MATSLRDQFIADILPGDHSSFSHRGNNAFNQLQQKSTEKAAALEEAVKRQRARLEANEKSWVGLAGVESDGVAGTMLNSFASFTSGAGRFLGNTAALVPNALAASDLSSVNEEAISAYNRMTKGQPLAGDEAILNRKVGATDDQFSYDGFSISQAQVDKDPNAKTALQLIQRADNLRQAGRDVVNKLDFSSAVNQDNRQRLSSELGDDFQGNWDSVTSGWDKGNAKDVASGIAGLLLNAGDAIISNPTAVSEYVVENIPQLMAGTMGLAGKAALGASNVGYAVDAYQKGVEKFQAENGGAYPPEAERQKMAMAAASLALAEQVGDVSLLKGLGKAKDASDTARKTLKDALFNTVGATSKGVATEATTEGYQTFAEGIASREAVTAKDIYEGAVIGGASGGSLSGGGRGLNEAAQLLTQPSDKKKEAENTPPADVQTEAIQTGDVSKLLDSKSKNYSPVAAVAALYGNSQLDTTTPEAKEANRKKAQEIVDAVEFERKEAMADIDAASLEKTTALLKTKQAQLAALDPADTSVDKRRASLEKQVELIGQQVQELTTKPPSQEYLNSLDRDLKKTTKQAEDVRAAMEQLDVLTTSPESVAESIALATQPTVVTGDAAVDTASAAKTQQAVKKVLVLAMTSPDRVDSESLQALVANQSASLAPAERTYLGAVLESRDAAEALKSMGTVNNQVLVGGKGFFGIKDYQSRMASALGSRNRQAAIKQLELLNAFLEDHAMKAAVAAAAMKQGRGTRIVRGADMSTWTIDPNNEGALPKGSKFSLVMGSNSLIRTIQAEAVALTKAAAELQQAFDLTFTPATTGETNVSQPAQVQGSGPQQKAQEAATTTATSEQADAAKSVDGRGSDGSAGNATTTATEEARLTATQAEIDEANLLSNSEEEFDVDTDELQKDSVLSDEADTTVDFDGNEETTTENVKSAVELSPGGLEVMSTKSPEGTPDQLRNLLADFMKQVASNEGDNTPRPLVAVKNFAALLRQGAIDAADYVAEKTLTEKQRTAIKDFLDFEAVFAPAVQENLPKEKAAAFKFEDLMQQLIIPGTGSNPDIEANVKTAIVAAVYGWVAENATTPKYLKNAGINALLGRPKGQQVTKEARDTLAAVGVYQHTLIDSLGARITDALGFKALPEASQALLPRLQVALGAHAMKMAEDAGLVVRTEVPSARMQFLHDQGKTASTPNPSYKGPHQFFRIARNADGSKTSDVASIYEAMRGTQNILGRLFKNSGGKKMPSLVPITTTQSTTSKTKQGLTKEHKDVVLVNQSRERKVRTDMLKLFEGFDESQIHTMIGVTPEEDALTHKRNQISNIAKNDGLKREYADFIEYVGEYLATSEKGLDTLFFLGFSVWKNQRVGIDSTVVNPQTSKIVRHLVGSPNWTTNISSDNAELMTSLTLRVGEGLGFKTERQDNTVSEVEIEAKLQEPVFANAIAALRKSVIRQEPLSDAEKASIVQGVATGKENLHSLDALVAVAYREEARIAANGGAYDFTVQLMGEVDGVANGTMLNHVLFGAAADEDSFRNLLEQGGFFEKERDHSEYNQYRGTPGNLDVYESTAKKLHAAVAQMLNSGGPEVQATVSAIWDIAGNIFNDETEQVTKDGRSMVKDALNPIAFGSSMGRVVSSMSEGFIDKIYAGLEKLSAKEGVTQAEVNSYIRSINVLLGKNAWREGAPIAWYMANTMSDAQHAKIMKEFATTVGTSIEGVVSREFGPFLAKRDAFNEAVNTTYNLFAAIYDGEREAYIEELLSKKELPTTLKGARMADLSKLQEAELEKRIYAVLPVLRSAMSKGDKGKRTGLLMAKQKTAQSMAPEYGNPVTFGSPMKNGNKTVELRGKSRQLEEPGVAMGSATTHSLDSAISHRTQMLRDVLNVHDAVGDGVGGLKESARLMNQNTWEALLNYSPMSEAYFSMQNVLKGIVSLAETGKLSPKSKINLQQMVAELAEKLEMDTNSDVGSILEAALSSVKFQAFEANTSKLKAMSKWKSVSQYSYQGGNYEVTPEDRDKAAEMLTKENSELTAQDKALIEKIGQILDGKFVAPKNTPVAAEFTDQKVDDSNLNESIEPDENDGPPWEGDLVEPAPKTGFMAAPPTEMLQLIDYVLLTDISEDLGNLLTMVRNAMIDGKNYVDATAQFSSRQKAQLDGLMQDNYVKVDPSVWGELGASNMTSDSRLVEAFTKQPVMTGKEALRLAFATLSTYESSAMTGFYKALLPRLAKLIPETLTVTFVTRETKAFETEPVPGQRTSLKNVMGWYVPSKEGHIYLMGPEFKSSGLTPEVIIHEVLHAVLMGVMDSPQKGTPAHALVTELEVLLEKAKAHVATLDSRKQREHNRAVENIHELVAYGMSNRNFQTDVLNKIQIEVKGKGKGRMVAGTKKFIETLVNFFFADHATKETTDLTNGMEALIGNVSRLMDEAAKGVQRQQNTAVSLAASPIEQMNSFTTVQVLDALADGSVSAAFQAQMRKTLNNMVTSLYGPFGAYKTKFENTAAASPFAAWLKAQQTGVSPFNSKVVGASVRVSEQELFTTEQVEATVRAALDGNEAQTKMAYRQLSELYLEARKKLKSGTLSSDDQSLYDFVFSLEAKNGDKLDHLARFAAMTLGHERMSQLMGFDTALREVKTGTKSIGDRVQAVFEAILAAFQKQFLGVYRGQQANTKLALLVGKMVDIEAKHRHKAMRRAQASSGATDKAEEVIKNAFESARKQVVTMAKSRLVRNNIAAPVKLAGAVVEIIAGDRAEQVMNVIADLRDKEMNSRPGLVAGTVNYMREPKAFLRELLLATKSIERKRKQLITQTAKFSLAMFAENGKSLNRDGKKAINQVFMQTGAHALLGMGMTQLHKVVSESAARKQAIADAKAKLSGFSASEQQYFFEQANVLGYFKATGIVRDQFMMMNAHNIAQMFGTQQSGTRTEEQVSQAESVIAELVALYAISYNTENTLKQAALVLETENARNGENGVAYVLQMHKKLEEDSKQRLFANQRALMMHGFAPDIFNPNTKIVTATADEGKDLLLQGYEMVAQLPVDAGDPDQEQRFMYVQKNGGLQPYMSSILSLTSKSAKGKRINDGYLNANNARGALNASNLANVTMDPARQAALQRMMRPKADRDLAQEKGSYMAPVVNATGQVVNWRYMMANKTKDAVLERNNDFGTVLGMLAGSIYDKETSVEQNKKVMAALKEQFDLEFKDKPTAYIEVGPNSPDEKMREVWAMLPEETRKAVRQSWGKNSLMVRKDALDMVFGYRKKSMADAFAEEPKAREGFDKIFAGVIETLLIHNQLRKGKTRAEAEDYAKIAPLMVAKGERVWQALIQETKDIVVVKTGVVMMGNIWSNMTQLWLSGMSIKDMMHHQLVALKGASSYRDDTERLAELEALIATGLTQGQDKEINEEILLLKDALARNPVTELVTAGLMPTIVEDLAEDDDIYSYKSEFMQDMEKYTNKVNPGVMKVVRTVYMTHDTKMYQGLNRITQLSDFVARYALYQHLVSQKTDPLSKEAAVLKASEAFVNYDIPLPKTLQYTDDMGITMFSKYFLSMQRILLSTARENPARLLGLLAFNNFVDIGPIVLDSSLLTRVGSIPLEWGPLNYVGAVPDLATVNVAMSLVK